MSTVLVTGGSGTLGSHLVRGLRQVGHEVRVISRRPGVGTHRVDLSSGEGVEAAVQGAQMIIHAASDTRRLGRSDVEQTRNLIEAAMGGVEHFVYVSIVGIDAIPFRYYRQKLRCEHLVLSSGIPVTVLRATQFHELLATAFEVLEKLPLAPLPAEFQFQSVAALEVAKRLVEIVQGPPLLRADDVGGPEVLAVAQIARAWRETRGRPSRFLPVRLPGKVARAFREGLNTCPEHAYGRQTWISFLADASRR